MNWIWNNGRKTRTRHPWSGLFIWLFWQCSGDWWQLQLLYWRKWIINNILWSPGWWSGYVTSTSQSMPPTSEVVEFMGLFLCLKQGSFLSLWRSWLEFIPLFMMICLMQLIVNCTVWKAPRMYFAQLQITIDKSTWTCFDTANLTQGLYLLLLSPNMSTFAKFKLQLSLLCLNQNRVLSATFLPDYYRTYTPALQ